MKANKVSSLVQLIKFGGTVPQSTKYTSELDTVNKSNHWKEAMKAEIDSLQEHGTFKVLRDGKISQKFSRRFLIIVFMMPILMVEESAE